MAQKYVSRGPWFTFTWKYFQYTPKPRFMATQQKLIEKMAQNLSFDLFSPFSGHQKAQNMEVPRKNSKNVSR